PDRRTVRCRIVGAIDLQTIAKAERDIERDWHEMRLRRMVLADLRLRVGAGRVEIAQADGLQAVGKIEIVHDLFADQLRKSVGAERTPVAVFPNQAVLRSVNGAGG